MLKNDASNCIKNNRQPFQLQIPKQALNQNLDFSSPLHHVGLRPWGKFENAYNKIALRICIVSVYSGFFCFP